MTAFSRERLLERATQIDAIAAKWSANRGYVETLRMESAALRFMAEHQAGGPTELERKHEDFQYAIAQGSIVEGLIDGETRKIEILFNTKNAQRKAMDTLLRFSLHGVQLPKASGGKR